MTDNETKIVQHYRNEVVLIDLWWHCEKCKAKIGDNAKYFNFCPYCGRKVIK